MHYPLRLQKVSDHTKPSHTNNTNSFPTAVALSQVSEEIGKSLYFDIALQTTAFVPRYIENFVYEINLHNSKIPYALIITPVPMVTVLSIQLKGIAEWNEGLVC